MNTLEQLAAAYTDGDAERLARQDRKGRGQPTPALPMTRAGDGDRMETMSPIDRMALGYTLMDQAREAELEERKAAKNDGTN